MQAKIIELKQAPVVLVELPEGAICPAYGRSGIGYILNGGLVINSELKGDYDFIGILSDLTEEQFNYGAFHTLLKSENVYTENPYGEKTPVNNEFYWGFLDDLNKWQEAQSRTIDPKRTIVLIRKEEAL